ncbi:hypothetical protein BJ138DRAFT_1118697, partial [Hygrophoropsis aurantiaca]
LTILEDKTHPCFASPDADIILGAKDRTLFRVHSYTLKTTSGWFRSLFSLPQRPCTSPPATSGFTPTSTSGFASTSFSAEVIHLDEDAHTLESLLRMICGLPVHAPTSYDPIDALLFAAEKYDMPGPISLLRILVLTPPLLDQPLRLYAAASRFGWDPEARHASAQTLALNIHAPDHRATLRRLDTDAVRAAPRAQGGAPPQARRAPVRGRHRRRVLPALPAADRPPHVARAEVQGHPGDGHAPAGGHRRRHRPARVARGARVLGGKVSERGVCVCVVRQDGDAEAYSRVRRWAAEDDGGYIVGGVYPFL